ncbi:MAG: SEFIR domain-containing protein [Rhodoplanes sp.]
MGDGVTQQPAPRVFISYSREAEKHQQRVLDLADRLRADGVDAEIDQYNPAPAEGWPLWCERQIAKANFVLMVCTESYHRRVSGDEEHGQGLGVVWEARIIRQLLYDTGTISEKFVPVLFADGSPDHIPTPIKGWSRYVVDHGGDYEALYRRLTMQPDLPRPKLGEIRALPPRPRRWAATAERVVGAPVPPAPCNASVSAKNRLRRLWKFLQAESNRQGLGLLGGALAAPWRRLS